MRALFLLAILLSGCGPEFKYGQYVCIVDGFYSGYAGNVIEEDFWLGRGTLYVVEDSKYDKRFVVWEDELDPCMKYPDDK